MMRKSTLTIGLSKNRLGELKEKIQSFRQEIITQFTTAVPPEEVVLLNIQMIPVTR